MKICPSCKATLPDFLTVCSKCKFEQPPIPQKPQVQPPAPNPSVSSQSNLPNSSYTTAVPNSSINSPNSLANKNNKKNPFMFVVFVVVILAVIGGVVLMKSTSEKDKTSEEIAKVRAEATAAKEAALQAQEEARMAKEKAQEEQRKSTTQQQLGVYNNINGNANLIQVQNIGQVNAPSQTAALLLEMLRSFNNSPKIFDLKVQVEQAYPKPYKGDVRVARQFNERGLVAFNTQNYNDAINLFASGWQANPADIEIINNLGFAYLKAGNYSQAEKILGEVLSEAPNRTSGWANLAEVYANTNRMDSAVAAFLVGFKFVSSQEKAIDYLRKTSTSDNYSDNYKKAAVRALEIIQSN
jgi:predicted Zn-dependent protease